MLNTKTHFSGALVGLFAAVFLAAFVHATGRSQAGETSTLPPDFFEAKVRPLLVSRCYDCHTDDEKGGLRLDSREAVLKGGESGPAIVPGNPDASLMIQAVRQLEGKPKMPKRAAKLTDQEIGVLVEWVRAGAPWSATTAPPAPRSATPYVITAEQRAFWSLQPLGTPAVPLVENGAWPKTDIDRFILARLEQEHLAPVRAADRRTLIRRATLDLTGLPPTPDEVEAFEKDGSPDAFEKVVDRLLDSPRYGEAWGRMWLDVARYGEDDYRSLDPEGRGYNPYPNAYLYRDWIVKAFQDDMPYDQFVKAQLAGDLLDERTRARTLPALGFLGLGPWYYDNGAVEITRADERHDRVDVVSRGFLGLTVGCARCHDHKYDPVPTTDYYAMAGVFANTVYHEYPLVPESVVAEYKEQEKKLKNTQKLLDEFLGTESRQLGEALAFQAAKYMQAAWRVTGDPKEEMPRVAEKEKLDYELFDRWIRFLAKPPKFYPFLTKWQEMIKTGGTAAQAKKLAEEFQAVLLGVMFEKRDVKEENDIIYAKSLPGTKKKEPANLPNEFITNDDFCPGCGLELKSLPIERTNLWTDVFQRDLQDGFDPAQAKDKIKPGLLAFRGWGLERQLDPTRREYVAGLKQEIEKLEKKLTPKYAYVHGVSDAEKPINLKVSLRGSPYRLGDEVPRRFLSVLSDGTPAAFQKGSGRLELADAILKQPLAVRVIVNRIWKRHFGTGIVDTPSNFGVTGDRPSHPELLEYLSRYFVDHGLSIKKLHREIMRSAVYQLASDAPPANVARDAGNRLYWRVTPARMTAEQIRDSILFVSGALDTKQGGPSEDLTPQYARRTLYGRVSRYKLDQYLALFDFPSPNLSSERRFATTVPLQRLFFMNSDFMQQQAEVLARRTESEADTTARIQKAYRLLFGRAATPAEVRAGLTYLQTEPMREYEERKAAAREKKEDKQGSGAIDSSVPDGDAAPGAGDGMMAGVTPGARKKGDEKRLLPPTVWGRYMKVLLSSPEFLFID
jgi:uncharacterized protein DUF1549/uncharacterized protein DUF1553/cytochrome c